MAKSSKSSKSKPAKPSRSKPAAARTSASKKKTAKKPVVKKKAAAKKSTAKKAPAKKVSTKKAAPKKTAKKTTKKAPAKKKTAAKKASAKKVSAKKAPAKKAAAKKSPSKKAPVKKKVVENLPGKKPAGRKTSKRPAKKAPGISETLPSLARGRASASLPHQNSMNGDVMSLEELSESKLKRAKSGLKKKDLDFFRTELLDRRAELLGDVENLDAARNNFGGEISNVPLHMADVGSENYDREFNLGLLEHEKKQLREIGEALERVGNGTYGVCFVTGQPIERVRLEIKPWAKYCIAVVRERERRGLST